MALVISQIYLSVLCAVYIVVSFLINFTFLITLLKLRRLNKSDKSSFFLSHLIFADFLCAFFILIPSGFGVYNGNSLNMDACHLQVFFVTFYFSLTFYGLFALSIERYFKYKYPLSHINFFTKRTSINEEGTYVPGKSLLHKTLFIIVGLWLLNLFIGFIPMFENFDSVQYFSTQSQCDYRYEDFNWWLWFYFWVSLTIPFLGSVFFFILTLRLIFDNATIINNRKNAVRANLRMKSIKLSKATFFKDLFFPIFAKKRNAAESYVNSQLNCKKSHHRVSDTTKLPENLNFYSHLINIENLEDEYENIYNDIHVRKQLLVQFKYDTERSKTATFFLITIFSYCLVFPVYVIHFYRTYNYDGQNYNNANVVSLGTYSAFVWISYLVLITKSLVCLIHNKFYRHSLYQSANCRGFHGVFDFEVEKFKKEIRAVEDSLSIRTDSKKKSSSSKQKLIASYA